MHSFIRDLRLLNRIIQRLLSRFPRIPRTPYEPAERDKEGRPILRLVHSIPGKGERRVRTPRERRRPDL
jgi:hypothetical protein